MPALDLLLAKETAKTDARERRQEYRRALAGFVFSYWAQKMGHPGARLDRDRLRKISARLEECEDDPRELLFAVDGALRDDWLMGKDSQSTRKYDQIKTLFRNREQIEHLAELVPAFKAGAPHPVQSQIPAFEDSSNGHLGRNDGSQRGEIQAVAADQFARISAG